VPFGWLFSNGSVDGGGTFSTAGLSLGALKGATSERF